MAPRKKQISDVVAQLTDPEGRLKYATGDLPDDAADRDGMFGEEYDSAPAMTANQLVAYNVQRARKARGWSQEYLGTCLERVTGRLWSKASVSAAESSWRGGRVRQFNANELLAFSLIFDLPLAGFILPPDESDWADAGFLADVPDDVGIPLINRAGLIRAAGGLGVPAEFSDRLTRELEGLGVTEAQPEPVSLPIDPVALRQLAQLLKDAGMLSPTEEDSND